MSKFISYQQYIETSFNKKLTKSVSLSLTASSWSGGAYHHVLQHHRGACHHVLHHILHHHGGACDDVLYNLQGYYSGGAQHDDYELYMVTGLTRSLLLDDFEEDDIQERPRSDSLHHSDPHRGCLLLTGGGLQHPHTGPRPHQGRQGEGGDIEDDQASVNLKTGLEK